VGLTSLTGGEIEPPEAEFGVIRLMDIRAAAMLPVPHATIAMALRLLLP
jgi:hypothetical protein